MLLNHNSIFQDVLNFSFVISTPPDMQYGSLNLDGTWTGIVNELIHKNAEIGMLGVESNWNSFDSIRKFVIRLIRRAKIFKKFNEN